VADAGADMMLIHPVDAYSHSALDAWGSPGAVISVVNATPRIHQHESTYMLAIAISL